MATVLKAQGLRVVVFLNDHPPPHVHVFAAFVNEMGGKLVRTIGIARAKTKIGLQTLGYNMKRFVWLEGKRAVGA